MRILLMLKPSLAADARLKRCPHDLDTTFAGVKLILRQEAEGFYAVFHDGFKSVTPAALYDHFRYVKVEETFACRADRRQGVYRLEDARGEASATLDRVPWTVEHHRSREKSRLERAKAGEADYDVLIRAANLKVAEELYLAIRRGTVLPVDDWDKEQAGPKA